MSNFDMAKIMDIEGFDPKKAYDNLNDEKLFFEKLTEFVRESGSYLSNYNPIVIMHNEETKNSFLHEIEEVKSKLNRLEITSEDLVLKDLVRAVANNNINELSDGFVNFSAKMKILSDGICGAQLPD